MLETVHAHPIAGLHRRKRTEGTQTNVMGAVYSYCKWISATLIMSFCWKRRMLRGGRDEEVVHQGPFQREPKNNACQ